MPSSPANTPISAGRQRSVPDQPKTVEGYIASFPADVQAILENVRRAIRKAAPGVEESIRYQIISFQADGKYLIYLGGWKHHVGLYPIPVLDETLEERLSQYRAAKDTVRFPLRGPVPYDLIERVVTRLVSKRRAEER